jgi:phytanoyl-CoA hydroxylase
MTSDTVNFRLSNDQLQHMQEDGYLIIERLFDDAELQPVIEEISADLDRRCREAFAAGKLTRTYEEFDFEHRLTHVDAETQEISKSMWDMKVVLPSFFGLMTNPRLLDVAEQLCGPELIASSVYRLRPKVPSHAWSPVPWHQDSAYFEAYCDLGLILTVWVPLVDATEERGCLWVMPRAHKGGLFFHRPDDMAHYLLIPDDEFGGRKPVCAPVPKGGVLLLTNRTPHASFENKTDASYAGAWTFATRARHCRRTPTSRACPARPKTSGPWACLSRAILPSLTSWSAAASGLTRS